MAITTADRDRALVAGGALESQFLGDIGFRFEGTLDGSYGFWRHQSTDDLFTERVARFQRQAANRAS